MTLSSTSPAKRMSRADERPISMVERGSGDRVSTQTLSDTGSGRPTLTAVQVAFFIHDPEKRTVSWDANLGQRRRVPGTVMGGAGPISSLTTCCNTSSRLRPYTSMVSGVSWPGAQRFGTPVAVERNRDGT